MRIVEGLLVLAIMITLSVARALGQEYQQSIDMHIPFTPDVVTIAGKPTAYYELHLTNSAIESIHLIKVEVVDAVNARVIASIDKDDLRKRYSKIGVSQTDQENLLPSGASGVIYLEFALQKDQPNMQIAHRLQFVRLPGNGNKLLSVQGALTHWSTKTPIILGPPLSAGPWAAVYDPSWERGHRRVLYTVNGKAQIPGRFAIDFIKLDNQGRYATKDDNVIRNWYGYGVDVLAVADGLVASTRDDFSETTLSGHPAYTPDQATGNYVSIDIGNNHVVFYEHLKTGSIKVKPGQQVKRGDIIAAVGFTGQTTGPHLHLHVANENSPLGAEGIPFAFERFTMLGSYTDFEKFGKAPWMPVKNLTQSVLIEERPAPNTVIEFRR